MKPLCVIIDSGHGGLIKVNNKVMYTTPEKDGKFFKHKDGTIAYEGVLNRDLKYELITLLDRFQFPYVDVTPTSLCFSLEHRIKWAKDVYEAFKNDFRFLYLSLHSNAGGGTGIEIYTSKGQDESDYYASKLINVIKKNFLNKFNIKLRTDISDEDEDKEADFYVLVKLKNIMPVILVEYLFFDNYEDWKLLQNSEYRKQFAASLFLFLQEINESSF